MTDNSTKRTSTMVLPTHSDTNVANSAPSVERTIATVAAELEAATIAATKVKALTEELRGMLFKKRGPRKAV